MPTSIFEGCTEWCGWTAAILAMLGFGSFGVPIKSASNIVEAHPFVMQSYKTLVCFLTCWFVVLMGEEVRWTSWGVVSGVFWVPSATCGIYAIRNAGLAISVGTWSSCYVILSFIWGILIFHEQVRNVYRTALAFLTLGIGLVGMAYYSRPQSKNLHTKEALEDEDEECDYEDEDNSSITRRKDVVSSSPSRQAAINPVEMESLILNDISQDDYSAKSLQEKNRIVFLGGRMVLTKRQLGIVGAVINGTWGGLNLIPLHYAKRSGFGGAAYVISYAVGAMVVNSLMWVLYFLYNLYQRRGNFQESLHALPYFHLEKIWLPGMLAGCLYSIANFGSILSVTYLGQGVGFSLCQVQILVSGLWGIFYFQEIKGRETISKWVVSACITVCGILWLTYEKMH